jgi:pimeloyl-ACP methyl ester carboxylesterase
MDRRSVLKSVVSAVAGAGLVATARDAAQSEETKTVGARAKVCSAPFVETTDGVSLFYRDWGTGRPIVFAAPWALHSDWWEHQMAFLAGQGLRCIGLDRRGHGRSAEPGRGYDFDTLADDLQTLIEQLDLREVTFVSQSMGCGEVVRYLSRHGATGRVARIVLVAPITPFVLKTADNPEGTDATYLRKVREALCADRPHVIAGAAPAFFGAPKNPVSDEMMQWWIRMLLQCSLRVMLDLQRMFTETDFRAELRAIRVPTLIVHGDNDTSTPLETTGRKTAALIQGSELKVYEDAAHGLPVTHADRLNRDLLAFVKAPR